MSYHKSRYKQYTLTVRTICSLKCFRKHILSKISKINKIRFQSQLDENYKQKSNRMFALIENYYSIYWYRVGRAKLSEDKINCLKHVLLACLCRVQTDILMQIVSN